VAGLRIIAPYLPYDVHCHELEGGERFALGDLQVGVLAVDHSLPCLAYTLERPRTPRFDPERARALGLPVTLWNRLQHGEAVSWDGRTVQPDAVLGPPRAGVKFAFVTDTRPTAKLPGFVAGAQLLVCEGMYGAEEDLPRAIENRHMLFRAYLPVAQAVFPNTTIGATGLTTTLQFPDD
jgi:ribonuclease Z